MSQSTKTEEEQLKSLTIPGLLSLKVGVVLSLFSFPVLWLYPFLHQIVMIRPILDIFAVVCQIGLIVGFILMTYGALRVVYHKSNREVNWWAWQTGPFK